MPDQNGQPPFRQVAAHLLHRQRVGRTYLLPIETLLNEGYCHWGAKENERTRIAWREGNLARQQPGCKTQRPWKGFSSRGLTVFATRNTVRCISP